MNTIVDSDALVGLFDIKDLHNKEAQRILEELNRESRKAGIPAYLNQDLSTNLISDGRVHGHPA
jgi:hypothetical protein